MIGRDQTGRSAAATRELRGRSDARVASDEATARELDELKRAAAVVVPAVAWALVPGVVLHVHRFGLSLVSVFVGGIAGMAASMLVLSPFVRRDRRRREERARLEPSLRDHVGEIGFTAPSGRFWDVVAMAPLGLGLVAYRLAQSADANYTTMFAAGAGATGVIVFLMKAAQLGLGGRGSHARILSLAGRVGQRIRLSR